MGSLLAIVLFAVPLITWLSGLILLTDSQPKLARPHRPPRELFPIRRNLDSPEIASTPHFDSGRLAVDKVSL